MPVETLSLTDWRFSEYFDAPELASLPEHDRTIQAARSYLASANIADHPFFIKAAGNKDALALWTSQESVITNHFSQTLFAMMALIKNVHIRSFLLPVVAGEHSALKGGLATGAHPHLLAKLVEDTGMCPADVRPVSATIQFGGVLTASLSSLPRALGCLGIGNEAMLIPEYTAVEKLFAGLHPRAIFRPFLRANIEEDKTHSALMEIAAISTFNSELERNEFLAGAYEGVDARVRYYDRLIVEAGI
jgi:hypothetical protein